MMSEKPTYDELAFLMDNPLLGIVYLDKQYRIVRCNVKFEKMFGYKLEEIKRKNLDEVVDGDQDMTMITQTGESIHGSGKRKMKDGNYIEVEIYGIPKILGGEISGTLGIYLDITDRKLAEETTVKSQHELEERVKERTTELIRVNKQLQEEIVVREQAQKRLIESEDKYRTYIEHANDGISVVHKGKLTFVNSRLAEIMGYKVDELVGKDFLQFIPKGKLNQITDNLKRRLAGEDVPQVYESRILHKDCSEIDVEFNITTIESNDEPATLTIIRDITERKQAEEALRKNQVIIESNIKYFENMNIISESVSQSTEVGEMIKRVIEDVFNIFKADRAWLLYPCDPDSPTFQVPYEHTKPEYPGALESGIDSPVDEGIKQIFEDLLSTDEVITYDLSNESFRNSEPVKKFYMQSQMVIAMHPKTGSPWVLGLHQCSHERIWTSEEQKLFKDISLKVKDALNNLLHFKELFNREQFLNRIIDQSPFATWISDSEGTLQRANPALKRFLNLTDEQLVGKYNVLNDTIAERQGLQPLFRTVFEDGKTITFSLEWDGNDMPSMDLKGSNSVNIEATMFPIHNSEGKLTNVILNWIDITERKQAEEAQRVSEEKYRVLYNNSPDMYVSVSPDNAGILLCNNTLLNKTGYSREELIGSPIFKMYHDDCMDEVKKTFQEFVETGVIEDKELILKRKDGSKIHVSLNVNAVKDETGQTQYSISSWRDITEAKQAEEALRESEERYKALFERSLELVYLCDFEGNFIDANDAALKSLGYTKKDIKSLNFSSLLTEDQFPLAIETVEDILKTGFQEDVVEYKLRRKDGEHIFVESKGAIIYRDGKPYAIQGIARNITDRKQAEEKRKQLQAQLQQAQKMEAMGTLAGGIAHDFNNLLMAIQGRTSIMLTKKDSSHPDIRHLKGIEDNIESAADLTNQLLGFARGGKYEVRPTDLNELIKKQNRMFGRTKKEITIRGKYEENPWSVEVDRGQIEQVLLNLYVNAWQAMPGGGNLNLETENVTLDENYVKPFSIAPGRYVKISVTDTGVGMDKATREKIFEPFFTTKEMGRGTGLGLASVYGIIKNHGGFINVYSEKGHGTTFNIYLPASEKEIIDEKKPAGDTLRGTETVLFVDDEDMIIEVAEEMFEQLGYKVLIARSGKEAIETYERNKEHIDIVLLDMIMPDMSGSDTYDRMKDIDPKVKVLLSSGYSINGQATEIMDRGCDGFIQKPFKMKELSQKLREILDGK